MTLLLSTGRSCLTHSHGITGPTDARDALSLIGSIVDGRYLVESVVGQGGFGIVYRARHRTLESPVALKVLRLPHRMTGSERDAFAKRFLQEGKLLFRLGSMHPGFVRVFEAGILSVDSEEVIPYLAMDWLDGEALDRQLQRMRAANVPAVSLGTALLLMSAIVESTATAHALGVAHLDIKPGNIFLCRQGSHLYPRLLDFGIAKMMRTNPELPDCSEPVYRGPRAMTPAYAAPEQWQSDLGPTGPWTDVHALALTFVELLTGERVFRGQTRSELQALCLAARRPTPHALGCELPTRVERIFQRALSLEPQNRYPNARAFWRQLCAAANFTPNSSLSVSLERFKLLRDPQNVTGTFDRGDPTALSQLFSESVYGNIARAIAEAPPRLSALQGLRSPTVLVIAGLCAIGAAAAAVTLSASRSKQPSPAVGSTPPHLTATTQLAQPVRNSGLMLSSLADPQIESPDRAQSVVKAPTDREQTPSKRSVVREPRPVNPNHAPEHTVPKAVTRAEAIPAATPPQITDLLHSNALSERN